MELYLIAGLGNPESDYSKTRHNMGFNTINKLAESYNIQVNKSKFKGLYGIGEIENKKVMLLKPQTYMNLSGQSIKEVVDFYKINLENLIVIYDDMDVEIGKIKVRKAGGPGSHNGMKSVVAELKSKQFKRIRVGIGKPIDKSMLIEYVIGAIPEDEVPKLDQGTTLAKEAVVEILKNGIDIAMNKFN